MIFLRLFAKKKERERKIAIPFEKISLWSFSSRKKRKKGKIQEFFRSLIKSIIRRQNCNWITGLAQGEEKRISLGGKKRRSYDNIVRRNQKSFISSTLISNPKVIPFVSRPSSSTETSTLILDRVQQPSPLSLIFHHPFEAETSKHRSRVKLSTWLHRDTSFLSFFFFLSSIRNQLRNTSCVDIIFLTLNLRCRARLDVIYIGKFASFSLSNNL